MVFVLDNYDSFTYNLVQYMGELATAEGPADLAAEPAIAGRSSDASAKRSGLGGRFPVSTAVSSTIIVRRNDEVTPEEVVAMQPDRILLSPGPCTPQEAGILIPLLRHLAALPAGRQIPVLGVCLGHQAIGAAFGGDVIRAPQLMHGKTSLVQHDGRTIFREIPQPMTCTRYHSLIVDEATLPDSLEISARVASDDGRGLIMALRHKTLPIEGVQFHPESVLTAHGKQLIANFLRQ